MLRKEICQTQLDHHAVLFTANILSKSRLCCWPKCPAGQQQIITISWGKREKKKWRNQSACLDLLEPRLTFLPGRGSAAAAGALADVGAGVCVVVEHLVTLLLALRRRLLLDVELMVVMRVRVIMPTAALIVTVAVHVVHHDAVDALSTVLTIRHHRSHSKTFPSPPKIKNKRRT